MNTHLHRITYIFLLSGIFMSVASIAKAQEMNDEFKKQLRQSLLQPDMKHAQQMYQPNQTKFQQPDEVLRVSPTTKLPTRLDRFLDVNKLELKEIDIDLGVTNAKTRHTIIPAQTKGNDFDPVRAIQRHKARKRQQKVDKIIKVYEMD